MECQFEGGNEWWGWFDSDKDAIHAFVAVFKEKTRFWSSGMKKIRADDRARGRKPIRLRHHDNREWIIQRLGYMKPGMAIDRVPWKTIYIVQKGDD